MRRDFQIAILLALAAIPAGVALMAAPEYIGILKEYPGPFFWGGFALTAGLFGAAIAIAFRGEAAEPESGHRRRMIALIGMIIFGLGFLGSATVYFWPARSITDLAGTPESASDIVFLPPKRTYTLRWDPPHQMGIYTFPDPYHGEPDQTEGLMPVFLIKNIGPTVLQDIEMEWTNDVEQTVRAVTESLRMKTYEGKFTGNLFSVYSKAGGSSQTWTQPCNRTAVTKIAYLAPEINNTEYTRIAMPIDINSCAEIYFAAVLPPYIDLKVIFMQTVVTITWKRPVPASQKFRIIAKAHSVRPTGTGPLIEVDGKLRPPYEVLGQIKFEVERL